MDVTASHKLEFIGELWGVETWKCPDCGRVVLIRYRPYAKVVEVDGDPNVGHVAFRMDLSKAR